MIKTSDCTHCMKADVCSYKTKYKEMEEKLEKLREESYTPTIFQTYLTCSSFASVSMTR